MFIPGMDGISEDPSVPVTGNLHSISKNVFVFPFPGLSALWIARVALTGFFPIPTGVPS